MSATSDVRFLGARYRPTGTRFRIYPQPRWVKGVGRPETVFVDATPRTIQAGPQDRRIYLLDARKKPAYAVSGGWPRYDGATFRPLRPDSRGHFAHPRIGTRGFSSAMMFATVRCVLDIWERYFGRRIPWHFRDTYSRLELVPIVEFDNASSKYGYIECGFWDYPGRRKPFAQIFEVVAHETGHCIVHGVIGEPPRPKPLQYRALDEGLADLVALVSSLHFERVVDRLLDRTRGYLFSVNALSRIGELSASRQIRKVFNSAKMSTLKWDPDPDAYKYDLSQVFSGGGFDVLVEIYQRELVRRGAISPALGERSLAAVHRPRGRVPREFSRRFGAKREVFKTALIEARDYFGRLLARTLERTSLSNPAYAAVVANMLEADSQLSGSAYRQVIRRVFEWREILTVSAPAGSR
jgi:hypothetical protein